MLLLNRELNNACIIAYSTFKCIFPCSFLSDMGSHFVWLSHEWGPLTLRPLTDLFPRVSKVKTCDEQHLSPIPDASRIIYSLHPTSYDVFELPCLCPFLMHPRTLHAWAIYRECTLCFSVFWKFCVHNRKLLSPASFPSLVSSRLSVRSCSREFKCLFSSQQS